MSNRMDTIWSQLDRKSTAIAEFTLRQYRTRISTWVVMIASVVALLLILLFYIEAMNTEIEAIDNDGDSFDSDGDGYPNGQEKLLGTNPDSPEDFPIGVEPDPLKNGLMKTILIGTHCRMEQITSEQMTTATAWNITIHQVKGIPTITESNVTLLST